MAQDWFFVVGIALEISGALLIAGPFIFGSRTENAARGMTFPTGGPLLTAQRERAYTYIGALLLVIGFALQLVGYVIDADNYWFIGIAAIIIATTVFIGWFVAAKPLARYLHGRANAAYDEVQKEQLRIQRAERERGRDA